MKKSGFLLAFLLFVFAISTISAQSPAAKNPIVYVCPPCNSDCDKLQFDKPGTCPHCGMKLVKTTSGDLKKQLSLKPVTICFYLQNGVEVLDFAGPMEIFSAAGFKVFTVSKTKEPIRSQGILSIIPDYAIDNAPPADVLVVFGGETGSRTIDGEVLSWIKAQKPHTQYYLSVCTGAFTLGRAGILDNLTATTYHTQIDNLRQLLPKTKVMANVRFVDNGNVITTAGISAGMDGALHLVEKLRGRDFAKSVATTIEYDKWIAEQGLIVKR
ncbi:DJ-1/PfpI family protein [Mucilaginibacter sabulilitoris]|uniref:DJ-1/PfpI family protein n=1 Tax=Mucilaginibacter sabulilitoris TaxID=1173583 RepID=A0ABZ0TRS7_9SPHI|nr:DJ-1/PfpI family protein [Mucilaginibacter sabulilitoris]WPU94175.1 DJ-1/PfpI family protein [Mucilaginibacter sabulilitoris]